MIAKILVIVLSLLAIIFVGVKIKEKQSIDSQARVAPRTLYSQAQRHNKLRHYPLVGQQKPRIDYMRQQHYSDETIAKIIARYDAILGGSSSVNPDTIPLWERIFELNPDLVLGYQHATWNNDTCDKIPAQKAYFSEKMAELGDFAKKIDFIELDSIGGVAGSCGQSRVIGTIRDYQAMMDEFQMPGTITINGSIYPKDDTLCQYSRATDWSGTADSLQLPTHVHGTLEEGWLASGIKSAYYSRNATGYEKAKSRVDEACAWLNNSQQSAVIWAYYEMPTPWWSHSTQSNWGRGHNWKNMRVAFTAAQMLNNVIFMYNPTNKSEYDDEVNNERAFWGDYNSVVLNSPNGKHGRVPSYGSLTTNFSKISSSDDSLDLQRENAGYLGLPKSKPSISIVEGGTFFSREFTCGYVYTNLSPKGVSVHPSEATKKVIGIQDPSYDDGSSAANYSVPGGDGLVLLKTSCLGQ